MANRLLFTLLVVIVILACAHGAFACAHGLIDAPYRLTWPVGAGNIPSFSYLEGKAFRHGDIEDILQELAKKGGGGLGSLLSAVGKGKFGGLDVKRVYFGNAMDVAGLSKLSRQQILNLMIPLGFLAHGYATGEFEVTEERLGVYLPVEHIDNPKDYSAQYPVAVKLTTEDDNKDARQIHPGLRPPVQQIELEIDPRTGMKNYIANEQGGWDTSAACIRRNMRRCIDMGRRARSSGNDSDLYEAYRLLGTFLHTLEDLPAHSNFCELALLRLGHQQVFCHVGDQCRVQSPAGPVPPLTTGTFGSDDFLHSLLGEATDHLSEASVSDLNKKIETAKSSPSDASADHLAQLMMGVPGGSGSEMTRELDQELYATVWQVLVFRDNVVKWIERTIEKIPGLGPLIERITDSINKFVFTTIEPYLKPIIQTATGSLQQGSAAVINKVDQYTVFNDPRASDPTHSIISKDHFGLILNEPAGELAQIIVRHTVAIVVRAWDDNSVNPDQAVNEALEALHHPFFATGRSQIQQQMMQHMQSWIQNHRDRDYVLRALSKEEVRAGRNKRKGHTDPNAPQSFLPGPSQLYNQASNAISNQIHGVASQMPGYSQYQGMMHSGGGGGYGRREADPNEQYGGGQQQQQPMPAYGGGGGMPYEQPPSLQQSYGHAPQNTSMFPNPGYDGGNGYQQQGYQQPPASYGGGMPEPGYGQQQQQGFPDPRHGGGHYGGGGGGRDEFPDPSRHHGPPSHHGGPPRHHGQGGHGGGSQQHYGQGGYGNYQY